jgi:hypothetical protein
MKLFSILIASLFVLGGCDGGETPGELVPDGGVTKADAKVAKSCAGAAATIPTSSFPYSYFGQATTASSYTASGVIAVLGPNACASGTSTACAAGQGDCLGWEPGTRYCWPATETGGRGGVCGVIVNSCSNYVDGTYGAMPACGTYAPGTLRVWSMGAATVDASTGAFDAAHGIAIPSTEPQYLYKGDPTGGYICLPNAAPYTIPC